MTFESRTLRCAAVLLTIGLATAGATPHASAAPPVTGPIAPTEDSILEITTDPEMSRAELMRGWVQERGLQVFARRPTALEHGDRIEVHIEGQSRDYRVVVRLLRNGKEIPEQPPALRCTGPSDELLELVDEAINDAMDRLIAARKVEEMRRHYLAEERFERQDTASKVAVAEQRREVLAAAPYRPAALGVLGSLAVVLGGGTVVGGAILTARGELESHNDLLGPTNIRTPGIVLLGVGSAMLVAGIGMIAGDVARCNKDRVACGGRGPGRRASRRMDVSLRGATLRW